MVNTKVETQLGPAAADCETRQTTSSSKKVVLKPLRDDIKALREKVDREVALETRISDAETSIHSLRTLVETTRGGSSTDSPCKCKDTGDSIPGGTRNGNSATTTHGPHALTDPSLSKLGGPSGYLNSLQPSTGSRRHERQEPRNMGDTERIRSESLEHHLKRAQGRIRNSLHDGPERR